MKYLLLPLFLVVLPSFAFAELLALTNKDGRIIHVTIDNYFPDKKEVAARINGEGRVVTFTTEMLDDASVQTLDDWYRSYAVGKLLRFKVVREPGEGKGTCHFKVSITSSSNKPIQNLRFEYTIAYKERAMEKKDSDSKKVKYEEVETLLTRDGEHAIDEIPARGSSGFISEAVPTENTQSIVFNKKKGAEEVRNKNAVQGIHIRVYSGESLLREVESKPGMKTIIEKYSKG